MSTTDHGAPRREAASTLTLTIGRKPFPVADLAAASVRYQEFRGHKSADHCPEGVVTDASGAFVARVSYNGRVWGNETWQSGQKPIMEAQ